jgi:hypothetical protein
MGTKLKNKVIDIFTLLIHVILSMSLSAMGWFMAGWSPESEDILLGNFIMTSSAILLIFYLVVFLKKNTKLYIFSILVTIIITIAWILLEGSMDAQIILFAYIIIFLPLSIYKYKLSKV